MGSFAHQVVKMDLIEGIEKLAGFVIDIVKANGFEVIKYNYTSQKGVNIECKDFELNVYAYTFLQKINVWLNYGTSNIDTYDQLIKQFKLVGFIVYTLSGEEAELYGLPVVKHNPDLFEFEED